MNKNLLVNLLVFLMLTSFYSSLLTIKKFLDKETEDTQRQMLPFGIIFFINYPLYYCIWLYVAPQGYENFFLRMSASALCIPLIFNNNWPLKLKPYLSLYWYFTVIYCLPFFFIFMTLNNDAAATWLLNLLLAISLIFLIFNYISFIFIFFAGAFLAIIVFLFTPHHFIYNPGTIDFGGTVITFLAAFIIWIIFSRNREKIEKERLNTLRAISASIAHELRTPLRAIDSSLDGIKEYVPHLIRTYQVAKEAQLNIPYILPSDYKRLDKLFENARMETRAAFNVIDMLLVKADLSRIDTAEFTMCNMMDCIDEAIKRYPFDAEDQKFVHINRENNFIFKGNELLIMHVIFNLLKNSLYYIKVANKGEIYISLAHKDGYNVLCFRDTGSGISAKILPLIFDKFYSNTVHGTGVGLAFCMQVMKSFGGDIVCESKEGEYTEFTLSFPFINNKMHGDN